MNNARLRLLTWLTAGLCAIAVVSPARGQTPPRGLPPGIPQLPPGMTPEQALQMANSRPELGALLRQRLQDSGMTPDEIRSRLRAAGYPSNLLDAYLSSDTSTAARSALPRPTAQQVDVISALGVQLSVSDSLTLRGDSVSFRLYADSLRADSIAKTDSVARIMATRRLDVFGFQQLRTPTTQYQPIVTGPVDDAYRLGPGDGLVLILTGAVQTSTTLEVGRDGFVLIPQVGQVFVNNLTMGGFRDVLYTRLGQVYSGVSRGPEAKTKFEITVSRVRSIQVRVAGQVPRPGTYQIAATGSVLSAIYSAGGIDEKGNFRRVEVHRGTALVGSVDLYDYLLHGIVSSDLRLTAGDVIFVPYLGTRAKITGEVNRPAIYEMKAGEGLRELIQLAGGLTQYAVIDAATINHPVPPDARPDPSFNRTILTVSLRSIMEPEAPVFPMSPGDSVTIYSVRNDKPRSAVTVKGNVWQPGIYRLETGMRLWDLIRTAGGLRPGTYNGRAQVVRLQSDSTRAMIGVTLPDSGKAPLDNPELRESDEITVFANVSFRPPRRITVFGAVRRPGIVPYSDSMTVRDAILLAGGLQDDAYAAEAEVSRVRSSGGSGDSLAVVFRVPLDSTFAANMIGYMLQPTNRGTDDAMIHLRPLDNIFIRRQPGLEVQRNVLITGEVRFPGRYSLIAKDERLRHVIERAGGLTSTAYANGIRFFRPETEAGRIGVDLPRVLRDSTYKDNMIMMNGDSIHIPPFLPTVRVEGEVNSPSSVTYVPGEGVGFYVDAAGGFTVRANKGAAYVQQPNGSIRKGGTPEPGAVVVVPQKDPNAKGIDVVALVTGSLSIIASLVTTVIVLTR